MRSTLRATRTGRAGRAVAFVAAASATALVLAACGEDGGGNAGGGGSGGEGGVFKIGLVSSSSGAFAANYKTMDAGAEYAVKLINDAGGIGGATIELIRVDTQANPTTTATLIPQLATRDKVVAIVGPADSAGCEIACAAANKLKLPIVSPGAGRPGVLANSRPYGFTLAQPDAANSTGVITSIVEDEGVKTAAIITDEANATAKAQADLFNAVFADTGVEVLQTQTYKTGDSSFTSQVTSLGSARPDLIALAAGPEDAGRIAREIRSQGIDSLLVGTGALQSGGSAYVSAGGEATEGTLAAAQYDPHSTNATAKELLEKAQTDTGQADIPLNFAYAFDAVNMIKQIIEDKGITPGSDLQQARDQIQEGLNGLSDYTGMADKTSFSDDGTAVRPQLRSVVQGGKFVIDQAAS